MARMTAGIMVGYDGSSGSEQALRWAVAEAKARGTALTVCLAWSPEIVVLLNEKPVLELARRRGEEILAPGLRYAESVLGAGRVTPLLAPSSAARALCQHSETADMVVVGCRGRGGVAGLLLGSVSWQVAAHGQGRVVVVRGWATARRRHGTIVVGTDGSADSQAAVVFALEEAALWDVPLLAVRALADAPGTVGGARRMEEDFDRSTAEWEKDHPEVPILRQVTCGPPRDALLAAAADAQMIVAGSRGLGGLRGMALGSVAHALLQHAPCPIGIVHHPGPGIPGS
jgi:nucleotide-binding universal stress UspA family protein